MKMPQASYRVSYHTALPGEAHLNYSTHHGNGKLCAWWTVGGGGRLKTVQLSKNIVTYCTEDLSANTEHTWYCDLNPALLSHCLFQKRIEEDLLSKCAVLKLLLFPTTYVWSWISRFAATKSKYCYRIDITLNVRIQLSTITPEFKGLCETNKQHHSSH